MERRNFLKTVAAILPFGFAAKCFGTKPAESYSKKEFFVNIIQVDKLNGNSRIYPRKVIEKVVDDFQKSLDSERGTSFYGEFFTAEDMRKSQNKSIVVFSNISHSIEELFISGDCLFARIKILDTPRGKILSDLCKEGKICFRPRGVCSIFADNGIKMIKDFKLISVDALLESEAACL